MENAAPAFPGLTDDGSIRQKRWAPRDRTGCRTCRTRRVKCDETRPECGRCIKSRVTCRGYELPCPDDFANWSSSLHLQEHARNRHVYQEPLPLDWDFLQSIRYFVEAVRPTLSTAAGRSHNPGVHAPGYDRDKFVSLVLVDRISRASKSRGCLLQPGDDAAFAGLWSSFADYMLRLVRYLNEYIADDAAPETRRNVFRSIQLLLCFDVCLQRPLWKAHMRGFLAYVQRHGGVMTLLAGPNPPQAFFGELITMCICFNTSTPVKQQFADIYRLTDKELNASFSPKPSTLFCCPPSFKIAIFRITKLRWLISRSSSSKQASSLGLHRAVHEIFDFLCSFDVDSWAREEGSKGTSIAPTLNKAFAVAIRLYGILTLPQSATAAWASSSPAAILAYPQLPGQSSYESVQGSHLEELLELLRFAGKEFENQLKFSWPLVVAGVAASEEEDRELIRRSLMSIWECPSTTFIFIGVVQRLQTFWRSGSGEWEDCFDAPYYIYA